VDERVVRHGPMMPSGGGRSTDVRNLLRAGTPALSSNGQDHLGLTGAVIDPDCGLGVRF
jgi:hypothetical protein